MFEIYIQNSDLGGFVDECAHLMSRKIATKPKNDQILTALAAIFNHAAYDFYYSLIDILKKFDRSWNFHEIKLMGDNNQNEALEYYLLNLKPSISVAYSIFNSSKLETMKTITYIIAENHLLSNQGAAILVATIYANCYCEIINTILENIIWDQINFWPFVTELSRMPDQYFLKFIQYIELTRLTDIFEIVVEHLKYNKTRLMIENYMDHLPSEINMSKILLSVNHHFRDDDVIYILKKFIKIGKLLKENGFILKSDQNINELFSDMNLLLQNN